MTTAKVQKKAQKALHFTTKHAKNTAPHAYGQNTLNRGHTRPYPGRKSLDHYRMNIRLMRLDIGRALFLYEVRAQVHDDCAQMYDALVQPYEDSIQIARLTPILPHQQVWHRVESRQTYPQSRRIPSLRHVPWAALNTTNKRYTLPHETKRNAYIMPSCRYSQGSTKRYTNSEEQAS